MGVFTNLNKDYWKDLQEIPKSSGVNGDFFELIESIVFQAISYNFGKYILKRQMLVLFSLLHNLDDNLPIASCIGTQWSSTGRPRSLLTNSAQSPQ